MNIWWILVSFIIQRIIKYYEYGNPGVVLLLNNNSNINNIQK